MFITEAFYCNCGFDDAWPYHREFGPVQIEVHGAHRVNIEVAHFVEL
jgi:hypothetical protein